MRRLVAAVAVALLAVVTPRGVRRAAAARRRRSAACRPRSSTITFNGDDVTPNGERHRRRGRPADRVRRHRGQARRDPRPLLPRAGVRVQGGLADHHGQPDQGAGPGHGRVAHAREGPVHPRGPVSRSCLRCSPSTAWAARRTCRSRASSRSSAPRRRSRSRSSSSRWPGASPGTTPPPAAGRLRPGWRGVRRLGLVARAPAPGRPARTGLPGRRRGPRQGPADQPDLRHLLRLDLGRRAGRLAALRPGLEGDQPVPADQRGHGPRLGR